MRMATLKAKVSCSPIITFESLINSTCISVETSIDRPEITFYKNLNCIFTTTANNNNNKE